METVQNSSYDVNFLVRKNLDEIKAIRRAKLQRQAEERASGSGATAAGTVPGNQGPTGEK